MVGLALSGGGVKGSYEIGAYYALKKCHIKIDAISGTSIGAFNGAMIASHQEKKLLNFWKNVEVGKILGFDEEYIKKINNKVFDADYIKLSFENIIKILKDKGISPEGIINILNKFNVEKKLRKSKILFGLCTYKINTRTKIELFIDEIENKKLNDYILASCYLPIFQKKKIIDDSYFFDGGIVNNLPINMLINKGCNKIYAVDLKAVGFKEKPNKTDEIIYISPSRKISSIITLDQNQINDNLLMGYYDTLKRLNKLDGINYYFKQKKDKYYDFLLRKVPENTILKAYNFFKVKTSKELIIRCEEFLLEKNKFDYLKIYHPYKILKKLKKFKDNSLSYEILSNIKFVF